MNEILPIRAQGNDGDPHLTFFDDETQLSFVWDGTQGDLIDVANGGYGEPVAAHVVWPDMDLNVGIGSFMASFRTVCELFAAGWKARHLTPNENVVTNLASGEHG